MKTGPCDHDDEPNNNLRWTQTEERLTALGLIHSHYHAGIDGDTVCKLFLQKHPCRMEAGCKFARAESISLLIRYNTNTSANVFANISGIT